MTLAKVILVSWEWIFLAVAIVFTIALVVFFAILLHRARRDERGGKGDA